MTGGIGFDTDDAHEDLARARRQAEDAPAHPRELRGWLEAEDSTESEDGTA